MFSGDEVDLLVESGCLLGEGPLWSAKERCLYWVDIEGRTLWRWSQDSGAASKLALCAPATFLTEMADGRLLAGVDRGFGIVDPDRGSLHALGDPLLIAADCVMNDGKADRQGRVVAGSKDLGQSDPVGAMLQLDAAGSRTLLGDFTVFNGPAFSPDGTRIYFADSPTKVIRTAPYDPEQGILGEPEVFVRLGQDAGYPDGMTVDAEGGLWNAEWDGGRITRYRPDGRLDRSIALPVPRPTSLVFGGADLATLYVTSARTGLSDDALASAPLSGAVFALKPGERGLAEAKVSLSAGSTGWSAGAGR